MFVVLLEYRVPVDQLDGLRESHLEHMRVAYDRGVFLVSGPRVPRTGAVMVARDVPRADLVAILDADPYVSTGACGYELVEFAPGLWDDRLSDVV